MATRVEDLSQKARALEWRVRGGAAIGRCTCTQKSIETEKSACRCRQASSFMFRVKMSPARDSILYDQFG